MDKGWGLMKTHRLANHAPTELEQLTEAVAPTTTVWRGCTRGPELVVLRTRNGVNAKAHRAGHWQTSALPTGLPGGECLLRQVGAGSCGRMGNTAGLWKPFARPCTRTAGSSPLTGLPGKAQLCGFAGVAEGRHRALHAARPAADVRHPTGNGGARPWRRAGGRRNEDGAGCNCFLRRELAGGWSRDRTGDTRILSGFRAENGSNAQVGSGPPHTT